MVKRDRRTNKSDFASTDVNECYQNNGGCNHTCVNEEGSFRCECNDGYAMTQNDKCEGIYRPFVSYRTRFSQVLFYIIEDRKKNMR